MIDTNYQVNRMRGGRFSCTKVLIKGSPWLRNTSGKHFGQSVAEFRKRVGMTQTQLAKNAGVSQALVSKIESAPLPSEAAPETTLRLIAKTLGASLEHIITGSPAQAPDTTPVPPPSTPTTSTGFFARPSVKFRRHTDSVEELAPAIGKAFDAERHDIRDTHVLLELFDPPGLDPNTRVPPCEAGDLVGACGLMLDAVSWLRKSSVSQTPTNLLIATSVMATRLHRGLVAIPEVEEDPFSPSAGDDIPF